MLTQGTLRRNTRNLFTSLAHDSFAMLLQVQHQVPSSVCTGVTTHLPFFFTDPQLVERPETREDAPAQPPPVAAFYRIPGGVNLHLHDLNNVITLCEALPMN